MKCSSSDCGAPPSAGCAGPKAFDFKQDGETCRVEFTRDNGERVIAIYTRMGWARPPAEVAADYDRRLNQPPQTILYPKAIDLLPETPGEES
jgi:hypothetical protein